LYDEEIIKYYIARGGGGCQRRSACFTRRPSLCGGPKTVSQHNSIIGGTYILLYIRTTTAIVIIIQWHKPVGSRGGGVDDEGGMSRATRDVHARIRRIIIIFIPDAPASSAFIPAPPPPEQLSFHLYGRRQRHWRRAIATRARDFWGRCRRRRVVCPTSLPRSAAAVVGKQPFHRFPRPQPPQMDGAAHDARRLHDAYL